MFVQLLFEHFEWNSSSTIKDFQKVQNVNNSFYHLGSPPCTLLYFE